MITCKISAEGDQVCAMIGENLQEGIAGFGEKVPDALRALAVDVEKDPMTLVVLMLREMSTQLQERRGEPRQGRGGDSGDEHVDRSVVESNASDEKPAPSPRQGEVGVELPNISDLGFVDKFLEFIHPLGLTCRHCGKGITLNKRNPKRYSCLGCKKSGSIFAGTIFAHSQQPLAAWAVVIHMMMQADTPTTVQVQERVGVAYETASAMMEKINIEINDRKYRPFFSEIDEMVKKSSVKMKPIGRFSI